MAAAISDYDPKAHVVGDPLEVPELACGAMAGLKPYVAPHASSGTSRGWAFGS